MRSRTAGMKPVGALSPFFIAVGALSLAADAYQGQQQPSGIVRMQTLNS